MRHSEQELVDQREARLDTVNYDTPNNPLTGTDQGEWPGGDSRAMSDGQWSLAMENLSDRRLAFLRRKHEEHI